MKLHSKYGKIKWICVNPETSLIAVLEKQAGAVERGLPAGIVLVLNSVGKVIGTVSDGDVRRALVQKNDLNQVAHKVMNKDPILLRDSGSIQAILDQLPKELEKRQRRSKRFLGKIVLVDTKGRPTRVLNYHQLWEQSVATHRHVVVLGMGYVGLTLALKLSEQGFTVTGVDISEKIVTRLTNGHSHVHEVGIENLLREQLTKNFSISTSIPQSGDVFIIAVGTPVIDTQAGKIPDLNILKQASHSIGENLSPGNLIVLRSTVPVGTTQDHVLPILESISGLKGGIDFHISFAPERTIEGKALQELRSLPQIIGGLNNDSVEATAALFRELTPIIIRVESLEASEMVKLINNSFRDLIFAFSNELALMASSHNLDIVECIRAANSGYPRDKVPLPSPGVGGPCLTKDPYILASLSSSLAENNTLSEKGRLINDRMYNHVVDSVLKQLTSIDKNPLHCKILLCGIAFKGQPETTDVRESPTVAIANLFKNQVNSLFGHDPVLHSDQIKAIGLIPATLPSGFKNMDVVLFLNNHKYYEKINIYKMVRSLNEPGLIYDSWHVFDKREILEISPCVYMGLSFVETSLK
jgi:nucleotide sugar dehydrogenase|tara:strand:- start:454 stop:2205 length:1752 start_codon:yes stop_codon:yes gene_type:complete